MVCLNFVVSFSFCVFVMFNYQLNMSFHKLVADNTCGH